MIHPQICDIQSKSGCIKCVAKHFRVFFIYILRILMLMWVFEMHDFPSSFKTILWWKSLSGAFTLLQKKITVFISVITLNELPLMCLHGTVYVVLSDEYMKPILRRRFNVKDDVYCPAYMTRICQKWHLGTISDENRREIDSVRFSVMIFNAKFFNNISVI